MSKAVERPAPRPARSRADGRSGRRSSTPIRSRRPESRRPVRCRRRSRRELRSSGQILLVQRADSGVWLYPTGWADIGYSPSEIALKEVAEETGIECEPVRL